MDPRNQVLLNKHKKKKKVKTQDKKFVHENKLDPKLLSDKLKETYQYKKAEGEKLLDDLKRLGLGGKRKKTRKRKRKRRKLTIRKRRRKRRRKTKRKKRLHHTVTYKSDKCSPKKSGDVLKFTCYTKDALFKLKDVWNARHRDNKILSNDPKTIWGFLHTHMSNTCSRESCWLKKNWIKAKLPKHLQNNTFVRNLPSIRFAKGKGWDTSSH